MEGRRLTCRALSPDALSILVWQGQAPGRVLLWGIPPQEEASEIARLRATNELLNRRLAECRSALFVNPEDKDLILDASILPKLEEARPTYGVGAARLGLLFVSCEGCAGRQTALVVVTRR